MVLHHEYCDILCQCIDLAPKPACMVGLTGQSWCLRSLSEDSDVEEQEQKQDYGREALSIAGTSHVLPMAAESDLALWVSSPDANTDSISPTSTDRPSRVTRSVDPEQHRVVQQAPQNTGLISESSFKWAMICGGNSAATIECSRNGYYCQLNDVVETASDLDQSCHDTCICIDLFSKTLDVTEEYGGTGCDYDIIQAETVGTKIPTEIFTSYTAPSDTDRIPHDFAMVCASDKQETTFCEQDGYSCDRHGKLVIPAMPNKYCNDQCTCISVGARKCCMMADDIQIYHLRHEIDSIIQQAQDPPLAIETALSTTIEITKRSEQYESAILVDAERSDLDSPPHVESDNWGPTDIAMVCAEDRYFTNFCQELGYFCSTSGNLCRKADSTMNYACESACLCVDLNPKPKSVKDLVEGVQHARNIEDPKYENNKVTDLDLEISLHDETPDWGSHNMAMVCWNDRGLTKFCAGDYGYYCTFTGSIILKADGLENLACEDNCQCIDLYPRPHCIMNLIGMAQCARDVVEGEHGEDDIVVQSEHQNGDFPRVEGEDDIRPPETGGFGYFVAIMSSESTTMTTSVKIPLSESGSSGVTPTTLSTKKWSG